MLRGWSASARHEECDAITGERVTRITSRKVSSETWETSTIMPSRFISSTISSPNGVRPPCTGSGTSPVPDESAQFVWNECVSVM